MAPDPTDKARELADRWGYSLNSDYHVSTDGRVHSSASDSVAANMGRESDLSRGASGGCGQDPDRMSDD